MRSLGTLSTHSGTLSTATSIYCPAAGAAVRPRHGRARDARFALGGWSGPCGPLRGYHCSACITVGSTLYPGGLGDRPFRRPLPFGRTLRGQGTHSTALSYCMLLRYVASVWQSRLCSARVPDLSLYSGTHEYPWALAPHHATVSGRTGQCAVSLSGISPEVDASGNSVTLSRTARSAALRLC